jgi:predicted lipid-binding transport protein (Tim44 family)
MHVDPLTIVFALVALVAVWKLWSVLGSRTGLERPPRNPFSRSAASPPSPRRPAPAPAQSNVVRLPGAAPADPAQPDPARWTPFVEGTAPEPGLVAIAAADPTFSGRPFLDGAKSAYEAVLAAFASGDRKALQSLLARDVYDGFDAALSARERDGAKSSTTIVSFDDAKIQAATLEGRTANVAVRFQSKQIVVTHAADGSVTDGSPDQIADIRDLWTFTRDVKSRDPNWKLAGTAAGH